MFMFFEIVLISPFNLPCAIVYEIKFILWIHECSCYLELNEDFLSQKSLHSIIKAFHSRPLFYLEIQSCLITPYFVAMLPQGKTMMSKWWGNGTGWQLGSFLELFNNPQDTDAHLLAQAQVDSHPTTPVLVSISSVLTSGKSKLTEKNSQSYLNNGIYV